MVVQQESINHRRSTIQPHQQQEPFSRPRSASLPRNYAPPGLSRAAQESYVKRPKLANATAQMNGRAGTHSHQQKTATVPPHHGSAQPPPKLTRSSSLRSIKNIVKKLRNAQNREQTQQRGKQQPLEIRPADYRPQTSVHPQQSTSRGPQTLPRGHQNQAVSSPRRRSGTIRPRSIIGLVNHGNTCYINAILQCLSHSDVIAEYMITGRFVEDLLPTSSKSKKFGTGGLLPRTFAHLIRALWLGNYVPEMTKSFARDVDVWSKPYSANSNSGSGRDEPGLSGGSRSIFSLGEQSDAQEFFVWLLDKMHEDLNAGTKKKMKPIKKGHIGASDEQIADKTWASYLECNSSFMQRHFQAQFRSSVTCPFCSVSSKTFDPYTCVSLSLPQRNNKPIFVIMVYYQRRPRLLCLGLNADVTATFGEVKQCLVLEAKVAYEQLIICQLGPVGFQRTFRDAQLVTELDSQPLSGYRTGGAEACNLVYAIEGPSLSSPNRPISPDISSDSSAVGEQIRLIAVNASRVETENGSVKLKRVGNPFALILGRECDYRALLTNIFTAMKPQLKFDVVPQEIDPSHIRLRLADGMPAKPYIPTDLPMPLYAEDVDHCLASYGADFGPRHLKIIIEWDGSVKDRLFSSAHEEVFDHVSACDLRDEMRSPSASAITLSECLQLYTEPEVLAIPDWRCLNSQCGRRANRVQTRTLFHSLPDILVFHLKRFTQLPSGQQLKLEQLVTFPLVGLDMSPYVSKSGNTPRGRASPQPQLAAAEQQYQNIFDLYAVCNHHGASIHSGHYTAFCRDPIDGRWHMLDDDKVQRVVNPASVITGEAYLLFYERRMATIHRTGTHSSTESGFADHWFHRVADQVQRQRERSSTTPQRSTPNNPRHPEPSQQVVLRRALSDDDEAPPPPQRNTSLRQTVASSSPRSSATPTPLKPTTTEPPKDAPKMAPTTQFTRRYSQQIRTRSLQVTDL